MAIRSVAALVSPIMEVLVLLRSAVSGNRAQFPCQPGQQCSLRGGGILNAAGASLTIGNSTVSGNHVSITGCSMFLCGTAGGGIYNGGKLVLYNSTITGNTSAATPPGHSAKVLASPARRLLRTVLWRIVEAQARTAVAPLPQMATT